jgi:hypothetical protein
MKRYISLGAAMLGGIVYAHDHSHHVDDAQIQVKFEIGECRDRKTMFSIVKECWNGKMFVAQDPYAECREKEGFYYRIKECYNNGEWIITEQRYACKTKKLIDGFY